MVLKQKRKNMYDLFVKKSRLVGFKVQPEIVTFSGTEIIKFEESAFVLI